ncbi:hypothetical protein CCACVL1_01712 [Corchorus capsularis]|uniref:Uncharacterized protein n=1 Tax=Corchorus capsularis TaxID=210143 RepID=A0A1R3KGC8_COCAP|nr:hypothetical protein CCACVL1_01712 [Corchorus capsularis]
MGVSKLVLVCLVLVEILVVQAAVGDKSDMNPSQTQIKVIQKENEPGWVIQREADEPAAAPVESSSETKEAEAPEIRRLGKHHMSDKSVAGGGVIIGGLVTAIFAAVYAYIRVTRKRGVVKY